MDINTLNLLDEGKIEGVISAVESRNIIDPVKKVQEIVRALKYMKWDIDKIEYWLGVYNLMDDYLKIN